jgi:hypothetical protein
MGASNYCTSVMEITCAEARAPEIAVSYSTFTMWNFSLLRSAILPRHSANPVPATCFGFLNEIKHQETAKDPIFEGASG